MRRRTALLIAIFSGALIAGAAVRDLPTQTVKLLPPPSPSAQEAHFGRSVALDADTMVVGVVDDERGADAGAVDIFYRNPDDGTWGRLMRLTASDGAPHDSFGSAVALDGDTLIVAAVLDDDAGVDSGSVSVFYRDQGGPDHWGAVAVVTAPDGTGGECFGTSVAVDGDTLVVGGLEDGVEYYFVVRAEHCSKVSDPSNELSGVPHTVRGINPPRAIGDLMVYRQDDAGGPDDLRLEWTPPTDSVWGVGTTVVAQVELDDKDPVDGGTLELIPVFDFPCQHPFLLSSVILRTRRRTPALICITPPAQL